MKLLVAYASIHGSTAEIARTIATVLKERQFDVASVRAEDVSDVSKYDAVVLGSAIYDNQWLEPVTTLLMNNTDELSAMPVWIFSSGTLGKGDPLTIAEHQLLPEELTPYIGAIRPNDVTIFGGKVDLRRLTQDEKERFMKLGFPKGDFRNWHQISEWANRIANWLVAWVPSEDENIHQEA